MKNTLLRHILLVLALLGIGTGSACIAQVTGVPPTVPTIPEPNPADDSLYIFSPARPLIDTNSLRMSLPHALGINVLFSNSGYGMGMFYERKFGESFSGFLDFGISGARNGDELEVFNRDESSVHYLSYYVPDKVNRVFHMPIMVGIKKSVFTESLFSNFRPFFNLGAGGTIIMTTPYNKEFFSAFGDADFSATYGGFVGIGAELTEKSPGLAVNARYYYLPISPGIESIRGEPIDDFGGLFLTLNVPF